MGQKRGGDIIMLNSDRSINYALAHWSKLKSIVYILFVSVVINSFGNSPVRADPPTPEEVRRNAEEQRRKHAAEEQRRLVEEANRRNAELGG